MQSYVLRQGNASATPDGSWCPKGMIHMKGTIHIRTPEKASNKQGSCDMDVALQKACLPSVHTRGDPMCMGKWHASLPRTSENVR